MAKKWDKTVLNCAFLEGDKSIKDRVAQIARGWSACCGIRLVFDGTDKPDVRIAFGRGRGSWSAIGMDATSCLPSEATMNFGWLDESVSENEWNRVVLHEFGHALGCIHEHSGPNFDREWNEQEVYEQFAGLPNGWSRNEIDHNILQKFQGPVACTECDLKSIMLYMFGGELFQDGKGPTNSNTQLSELDKKMIASVYP